MTRLEMYLLLWVAYLASLAFMWVDINRTYRYNVLKKYLFYLLTNGTLILRVVGVFWFMVIIHGFVAFFIIYVIIYTYSDTHYLKTVQIMFVYIPLLVQIVLACILFFLRMIGRTVDKGFYAGIHAHLGILIVVVNFWNLCHTDKEKAVCGIMNLSYMLMYFIITLNPHFQGLSKAIITLERSEEEPIETLTTLSKECGPVGPGHRRNV